MLAELSLLEPLESRLLLSKPLPTPHPEQLCPRHPHGSFSQALKEEFANSAQIWLGVATHRNAVTCHQPRSGAPVHALDLGSLLSLRQPWDIIN